VVVLVEELGKDLKKVDIKDLVKVEKDTKVTAKEKAMVTLKEDVDLCTSFLFRFLNNKLI
jgi:hypothetical protein